jgi:hypothetical protein
MTSLNADRVCPQAMGMQDLLGAAIKEKHIWNM